MKEGKVGLLEALKYLMNGAKFPNWAKLILALCIILAIYIGQFATVGQLANTAGMNANAQIREIRGLRNDIAYLNDRVEEVHDDLASVAARDSIRSRRLEKKIDRTNARIDDISENGTDNTNERIEELLRAIKKRPGQGG